METERGRLLFLQEEFRSSGKQNSDSSVCIFRKRRADSVLSETVCHITNLFLFTFHIAPPTLDNSCHSDSLQTQGLENDLILPVVNPMWVRNSLLGLFTPDKSKERGPTRGLCWLLSFKTASEKTKHHSNTPK